MQIRNLNLGHRPVLLAPMEDVTDIGFRLLCRRLGASMVYSEFVASDALVRMVNKSIQKLTVCDDERPVVIQIYGRDPGAMAEAAEIVVEKAQPDILDLNFGCPVKKVAGKGAGSGMLQTPELMQEIIGEVKRNPRMHIPIIGNGDITSGADALRGFEEYGVDAVMVGRATFGRPWIFKEIRDTLDGTPFDVSAAVQSDYAPMSPDWQLDVLKEEVRQSVERIDEYRGILHVRRHLAATPLFKGIPNFRQTRIQMLRTEKMDELFELLESIRPLLHADNLSE